MTWPPIHPVACPCVLPACTSHLLFGNDRLASLTRCLSCRISPSQFAQMEDVGKNQWISEAEHFAKSKKDKEAEKDADGKDGKDVAAALGVKGGKEGRTRDKAKELKKARAEKAVDLADSKEAIWEAHQRQQAKKMTTTRLLCSIIHGNLGHVTKWLNEGGRENGDAARGQLGDSAQ